MPLRHAIRLFHAQSLGGSCILIVASHWTSGRMAAYPVLYVAIISFFGNMQSKDLFALAKDA